MDTFLFASIVARSVISLVVFDITRWGWFSGSFGSRPGFRLRPSIDSVSFSSSPKKREHDVIHATAPRPKASKSKSKSKHKYPCQVPGCVKIYNSLPGIRGHYQTGHTEEERALLPKGDAKKGGVERDSSLALGVQDLQDGEDSEMSDSD